MYSNPFVAQLVAKECAKDAIRQAEQARLVREAEESRKSWDWSLPKLMTIKNLPTFIATHKVTFE